MILHKVPIFNSQTIRRDATELGIFLKFVQLNRHLNFLKGPKLQLGLQKNIISGIQQKRAQKTALSSTKLRRILSKTLQI